MIQTKSIAAAVATNSVAAATAVDMSGAQAGPAFANVGAGNAVACIRVAPGTTPGDFTIVLEQSPTGGAADTNYTTVATITQANYKALEFRNVSISQRYLRVNVTDATANAGTVDVDILSA